MTVNAAESQPQVRAGGLPTNTPRTIQRPAQPVAGDAAQAMNAEVEAQTQPEAAEKPKRKYKPRNKPKLNTDAALSREELAAWGEIALQARQAGVSVEKFMTDLEESVGLKLQVWNKLKAPVAAESADEAEPTVQA